MGDFIINRAKRQVDDKTPWQLDGNDIKSDHFIRNFYEGLLPKEERLKCVPASAQTQGPLQLTSWGPALSF